MNPVQYSNENNFDAQKYDSQIAYVSNYGKAVIDVLQHLLEST
ncbi:hypothetical protein ACFPYJ_05490 [Paenibacillus solisilvae]|uniref:Uncharacterized protein n=1 Tax=Paenibacillus solisilvae TaxID=2486751 RepID=A0ABW0VWY6_9BACL